MKVEFDFTNKDSIIASLVTLKAQLVATVSDFEEKKKKLDEFSEGLALSEENMQQVVSSKHLFVATSEEAQGSRYAQQFNQKHQDVNSFSKSTEDCRQELEKIGKSFSGLEEIKKQNETNFGIRMSVIEKAYEPLISPCDYMGIDYMIYALKTGRCDTIKEALNFLTEEERNQRLVATIAAATQYLATSFTNAMGDLGDIISAGFNMICGKLDSLQLAVETSGSQVSEKLGKVGEAISSAVSIGSQAIVGKIDNIRDQYLLGRTFNII